MSLLKKPSDLPPEHQGVTVGPPVPKQAPEFQRTADNAQGVQTGVKLTTALPEDPTTAAARKSTLGFRPGIYVDNAGTAYAVVMAADGHITYGRLDGGHPAQFRTIPAEDFASRHYRLAVPGAK